MADKLTVYNGALLLCKTRMLASLSESNERIRLLNAAWASAIDFCLETGQWSFATRTGQIDYTPSVEPDFGYTYAFTQPTDMIRPVAICEDEYFGVPLLNYSDERHYWYCDLQTIYVRWVSNSTSYGGDVSLWSTHFSDFAEAYLARKIVGNLTQDKDIIGYVNQRYTAAKREAKSLDAMNKPTEFLPEGSWVSARRNGGSSNRERGRLGT